MERGWKKSNVLGDGENSYVSLVDFMGTDESIVEAARMSTGRGFVSWDAYERCSGCDAAWTMGPDPKLLVKGDEARYNESCAGRPHTLTQLKKGDAGLLERLYADRHATPFEMCELAIEVQAPIFVFREWHRHRTQSYNEMSARYIQMPNLHYIPTENRMKAAGQSKTNKQGSGEVIAEMVAAAFRKEIEREQERVYVHYEDACAAGIAKELARVNTPVARYSRMRAKANLRNWLGFLALRMDPAAQWEIRQYAQAVSEIIGSLFPRTFALFEEHTRFAVTLSRTEAALAYKLLVEAAAKAGNAQPPSEIALMLKLGKNA